MPGAIGARFHPAHWSARAGGSGDGRGDDVGGVPVEGVAGSVVAHRGARIGMRRGFLYVA